MKKYISPETQRILFNDADIMTESLISNDPELNDLDWGEVRI